MEQEGETKRIINVAFHNLCINQALIAGDKYHLQSRGKFSDNKNKAKINKRNIKIKY